MTTIRALRRYLARPDSLFGTLFDFVAIAAILAYVVMFAMGCVP